MYKADSVRSNGCIIIILRAIARDERYVYDGSNLLLVLKVSGGSETVAARYLNGLGTNEVLAEESGMASNGVGNTHWSLTDQEGSVRDVVNNSGLILDHIVYGAFGNIISQTNSGNAMRMGYTGQVYDTETGLNYDHARYYDSQSGRFISQDPKGFAAGDANLYRYVGNNPLTMTDPLGMDSHVRKGSYSNNSYSSSSSQFGPLHLNTSLSLDFSGAGDNPNTGGFNLNLNGTTAKPGPVGRFIPGVGFVNSSTTNSGPTTWQWPTNPNLASPNSGQGSSATNTDNGIVNWDKMFSLGRSLGSNLPQDNTNTYGQNGGRNIYDQYGVTSLKLEDVVSQGIANALNGGVNILGRTLQAINYATPGGLAYQALSGSNNPINSMANTDFSYGMFMNEAQGFHGLSKELGGNGLVNLVSMGAGSLLGSTAAADNTVLGNANYAQKTYTQAFGFKGLFKGQTVQDVAGALRSGTMKPVEVPIEYIVRNGQTLILNTRSSQALEQAGVSRNLWNRVNMTGNVQAEVRLTNQLLRNGLTSQGTPFVLPKGSN